jgi:two-component system cell cycle response regulator CtrA
MRLSLLEAENEQLRERIAYLEREFMGADVLLPLEWRLTSAEARLFGVLIAREMATKQALMTGIYGGSARDEAQIKIVDVFICKIRKKLRPFGIELQTFWGLGYGLDAETRARLAKRKAAA